MNSVWSAIHRVGHGRGASPAAGTTAAPKRSSGRGLHVERDGDREGRGRGTGVGEGKKTKVDRGSGAPWRQLDRENERVVGRKG